MMCILESSDYLSSMGPPKELSSQDGAFSESLGKRKSEREAERMEA
jgi:hypothetical protein